MRIVIICCALVMLSAGCMGQMTEENPFGIDPNDVQPWVDLGIAIGRAAQTGGVATGNPALIGYGAVLVLVGGWVTNNILKKGDKDGES